MRRSVAVFGSVLALILLIAGSAVAQAQKPQPPKVEGIDVLRPGIYQIEVRNPIPDKAISTGNRVEAKSYKNIKVTTQIPATAETIIGVELTIVGAPRRAKVPLKVVWRYPAPGLTNPETKLAKLSDEYADNQLVGVTFPIFWGLTQDWHLVSGTWTLEVWHGERKLVAQEFQVVRP